MAGRVYFLAFSLSRPVQIPRGLQPALPLPARSTRLPQATRANGHLAPLKSRPDRLYGHVYDPFRDSRRKRGR